MSGRCRCRRSPSEFQPAKSQESKKKKGDRVSDRPFVFRARRATNSSTRLVLAVSASVPVTVAVVSLFVLTYDDDVLALLQLPRRAAVGMAPVTTRHVED